MGSGKSWIIQPGEEYLGSLENYIDRQTIDSRRIRDLFDFLFREQEPEYERRAWLTKITLKKSDDAYCKARDLIEDAMINGGYENGVIAIGPIIVNSTKERRQDVENLVDLAAKIYMKHLLTIDDYGTGKRNELPLFALVADEIEKIEQESQNAPKNNSYECDNPYHQ